MSNYSGKNPFFQPFKDKWANRLTGEIVDSIPFSQAPAPAKQERAQNSCVGLSTAHISPDKEKFGFVEVYKGGGLLKVSKPKPSVKGRGGGVRGSISTFTRGSRRRLMQKIAKTKKVILPVFVTLTYPAEFPAASCEWKRHIDVFSKRLERAFPKVGYFWKLEPQKRGAPHYHLIVWGALYVDLLGWVGRNWYEVVGSGDEKHLRAGTRVEKVRSWQGVLAYAAKYLGKVLDLPDNWDHPGRFWGVRGAENIPWADVSRRVVNYKQAVIIIRLFRRLARLKSRDYRSLTVFGDGDFWDQRLDRLLYPT